MKLFMGQIIYSKKFFTKFIMVAIKIFVHISGHSDLKFLKSDLKFKNFKLYKLKLFIIYLSTNNLCLHKK